MNGDDATRRGRPGRVFATVVFAVAGVGVAAYFDVVFIGDAPRHVRDWDTRDVARLTFPNVFAAVFLLLAKNVYSEPKPEPRQLTTCYRCGYDLRATAARRCPECFASRPLSEQESAAEKEAATVALMTMTAVDQVTSSDHDLGGYS